LTVAAIASAVAAPITRAQTPSGAQTLPDLSGVYYPVNAAGGGARAGGAPPAPQVPPKPLPAPTRTAPLSDGSRGRSPDAPVLTPEYMKKWEAMRDSRIAGSSDSDNTAKCLPPGMPAMMNMAYGMEIMQTKDKVTFFSELNDALRRAVMRHAGMGELEQLARDAGMRTMYEDGIAKALAGVTTIEEVLRVTEDA